MKLTRKQEIALINFGMAQLLSQLTGETDTKTAHRKPKKSKRSWSPQQRKKFAKTMAAVWRRKKAEKNGKTV